MVTIQNVHAEHRRRVVWVVFQRRRSWAKRHFSAIAQYVASRSVVLQLRQTLTRLMIVFCPLRRTFATVAPLGTVMDLTGAVRVVAVVLEQFRQRYVRRKHMFIDLIQVIKWIETRIEWLDSKQQRVSAG